MFVDASALVSILLEEDDFAIYASVLERSATNRITPFVRMEAGLAVMGRKVLDAERIHSDIEATLLLFRVTSVALNSQIILAALQAFERFGKGRHPAKLNMGDCLSYGAARVLGVPLLYKGDDFAKTDIPSALA
jgi:ribonuclease VapC